MFHPTLTLTVHNAGTALEAGLEAVRQGQAEIDLGGLDAVDSAAVATLLAWQRAAASVGRALKFSNPPASLQSLARLYGVAELLHFPPSAHHRHPDQHPDTSAS